MEKLTIEQFGSTIKQKYPQYANLSDEEVGRKTIAKYPQYQEKVEFSYAVPKLPVQVEPREQKIARLTQEAKVAEDRAKQEGSLTGMAKNFGKAFVGTIANSEVGLGKSIQKIFGNQQDTYNEAIQQTGKTQADLVKRINQDKALGKDTTKLQQLYNEGLKVQRDLQSKLKEETTLPTTGQVAGQLGGTALDVLTAGTYGKAKQGMQTLRLANQGGASGKLASVLPSKLSTTLAPAKTGVATAATISGLPELAKISQQKASGLLTGKGLTNITKGAGVGYGFDVTQGLQGARGEDRSGEKALIPGLGTALGAAIPAVSETVQSFKNKFDPTTRSNILVEKRTKELNKLDNYQTLKKAAEKGRERGIDVKKVLADTDVLHGSVDNTGHITTKGDGGAVEQYTKQFIEGNERLVADALKKEARSVSPDYVKARLIQKVKSAGIEGKALTQALKSIDDEVAGYALRAGDNGVIPVSTLHDAKINKYDNINFFTEGNAKQYDKTIAKALKEMVEENTTSLEVQKVNEELSKHFAVIDYLNKLDGKKVEGGKLGKYFAQTVGAMVGSHFGPLGAVAGAEAGGRLKGGMMSRVFNGKTGKVAEEAGIFTKAKDYLKSEPLMLNQSKSNNLGSRNINQSTTMIPISSGISNKVPQTLETSRKLSTPKTLPTAEKKLSDNLKVTNTYGDSFLGFNLKGMEKRANESGYNLYDNLLKRVDAEDDMTKKIEAMQDILEEIMVAKPKKGMLQSAIDNLKDPKMRQGGYIRNPLAKKELPVQKSSSLNDSTDLIQEAKKYKSAEEFVNKEPSYFHTTKIENVSSIEKQGFSGRAGDMSKASGGNMQEGVFLYPEKSSAEVFGKNFKNPSILETKVNGKIYDANTNTKYGWEDNLQTQEIAKDPKIINQLKDDGYVGVKSTELGTDAVFVFDKSAIKTKSQLEDIWKKAQGNSLSNDLIEASVASKLPPRTAERMKPNFTPELNKNIAEIIDAQRGIKKVSPEKMIELEADMSSIIEDFGFAIPKTKAGRLKLLDLIYNQAI